jgi:hypothetical protein
MTSFFNYVMGKHEASSATSRQTLQGVEDASYLSMTKMDKKNK